jgi:SM-20-related protein
MTPKQILDSFSETLVRDERILSAQERALVATLLQHARTSTGGNPQTQEAVRAVIASAIGETVAQRAFTVLGGSIVERILENSAVSVEDSTGARIPDTRDRRPPQGPQPPGDPLRAMSEPDPPGHAPGQPQPPGVRAPHKEPHKEPHKPVRDVPVPPSPSPQPEPPGAPMRTPGAPSTPGSPGQPEPPGVRAPQKAPQGPMRDTPVPVTPKEPDPPGAIRTATISATSAAVADKPLVLPAQCVVLDEFLSPQELDELTRFTLEHEDDFSTSEVVSPHADGDRVGGIVNYEHRRSRVLMDLVRHEEVMLNRIKAALPQILETLGMEQFSIAGVEAQVTASNDGDFFHFHSDNGSDRVASRYLTFVYFFHREPRRFEGGELRIHDARLENGAYASAGSYQTIIPRQNQIVFFPCELMHEITPVNCSSQHFADSRFTLNGWLRR